MGILIVIFILAFHTAIFAQPSYELDVHYGFGASELSLNSVPGIGISIYPIKNFGISTGLEYSWRWQTKTSSLSGSNPPAIDDEGDSLIFKYAIDKYKEEWQGNILQIPILLKYNNDFYYAAAGIKIGIPYNIRTNISYEGLKTEGHYFKDSLHLPAPNFQGFGTQKDSSSKTKVSNAKNLIMLAMEGGAKFKLSDNFSLLAGAFADYSLNKGFDRTLSPIIERIQKKGSANIVANDTWKSWQPWSVGAMIKFSFSFSLNKKEPQQIIDTTAHENPNITVKTDTLPPPIPVEGYDPQSQELIPPSSIPVPSDSFHIPPLPEFLLNREADFIFHYPETRTSPSDSSHLVLISQIADILRTKPGSQFHCVGYSEKLISESVAYETAFQRALRIRYTLSRFYAIEENRIFTYSQGSKNLGYRRAECFIFTNVDEFKP
jgi:hypothetical protein